MQANKHVKKRAGKPQSEFLGVCLEALAAQILTKIANAKKRSAHYNGNIFVLSTSPGGRVPLPDLPIAFVSHIHMDKIGAGIIPYPPPKLVSRTLQSLQIKTGEAYIDGFAIYVKTVSGHTSAHNA